MAAPPRSKDELVRRCPRLGSPVPFGYCRKSGDRGLPCLMVFDCWWEVFDVVAHLRGILVPEDFGAVYEKRPKPKMTSLLEIIEQAKKRTQKDE